MQPPDWFQHYVDVPRTSSFTNVDGARIHYQSWPSTTGHPGLLFVHGNGAHSHWWDFIAPAFADDFNVMAIDLSGSGDSDHRERYSATVFVDEIMAACRDSRYERPFLVGHSFGGSMTRIAGYLNGEQLGGIVLVDSVVAGNRGRRRPPRAPTSRTRYYETLEQAKKRFRLRPPQPCENAWILDYIAAHSLRHTDKGYRFKLDQALFSKMVEDSAVDLPDAVTMVRNIACPTGFIYGEQSRFFSAGDIATLASIFDPRLLIGIANAHHHVFLDQPLAFIEALQTVLQRMIEGHT